MLERLFLSRFYPHVTSSPHFNHLQSAYRKVSFDRICSPSHFASLPVLVKKVQSLAHRNLSDHSQTIRIGSCIRTIQLSVWCPSRLRPWAHTFLTLYLPSWAYHLEYFFISRYADDSQLSISLVADSIRASLDFKASNLFICCAFLALYPMACVLIPTIRLNHSGHSPASSYLPCQAVKIADTDINVSNEFTSLGVIMDSKLTLDSHIYMQIVLLPSEITSAYRRSPHPGHGYFSCCSYCVVSS